MPRKPLVLTPQYFGCRLSTGAPPATCRSTTRRPPSPVHWHREPIDAVLARHSARDMRDAVEQFIDCFSTPGLLRPWSGLLAADVLDRGCPRPTTSSGPWPFTWRSSARNLTCTHCFAGTLPRNHDPLRVAEMDALFADLAGLGSFRLGLTGGEPLLRKDLSTFLDAAVAHGCALPRRPTPCADRGNRPRVGQARPGLAQRQPGRPDGERSTTPSAAGIFAAVLDRLGCSAVTPASPWPSPSCGTPTWPRKPRRAGLRGRAAARPSSARSTPPAWPGTTPT